MLQMIALAVFALLFGYIAFYYWNVRRYPKGPLPLPLIGNLYHLKASNMHKYLHEVGKEYGSCFTIFLPRPVVVFTDFALIKEALVDKGEHFIGRSHLPPQSMLHEVDGTGLLTSDGEVWRDQRRTSLRILREFGMGKNLMEQQVGRSLTELLRQVTSMADGVTPLNMHLPLQLCVGNVINETLFGYHFKYDDTARFEHFVATINEHLRFTKKLPVFLLQAWPWLESLPLFSNYTATNRRKMAEYHRFLNDQIDEALQEYDVNEDPQTFVQAYAKEMDKQGGNLDLINLRSLVADFWLAGMETTSTTLRWSLLYLMKHPAVQDRLRSELDSVVGKTRLVEMADKPKLPYMTATIHEIQRSANMVPFLGFHRCTSDSVVDGKSIPKDTLTWPQIHSVMDHDPLFENPQDFRPERFLEKDGKTLNKTTIDRLIVFGMGKRQCVGEGLARMELFLILGALIQCFRFEAIGPLDTTPVFGSVLQPQPYQCTVTSLRNM